MPIPLIWGVSVAFGFLVWGVFAAQYIWPAISKRDRTEALRPILVLHGFRGWYPVEYSYVGTPTAFGVFAHQTVPEGEPPRSYLERVYNIQRWTVFPRGGHFAPVEEPAAVAGDLTAFFYDRS